MRLSVEAKQKIIGAVHAQTAAKVLQLRSGSIENLTQNNEIIHLDAVDFGYPEFVDNTPLYPLNQFHNGKVIYGVVRMIRTYEMNGIALLNIVLLPIEINGVLYDTHFLALKNDIDGYLAFLSELKARKRKLARRKKVEQES